MEKPIACRNTCLYRFLSMRSLCAFLLLSGQLSLPKPPNSHPISPSPEPLPPLPYHSSVLSSPTSHGPAPLCILGAGHQHPTTTMASQLHSHLSTHLRFSGKGSPRFQKE